ncbi:hypothetical protein AVEN_78881-1 [Araneus ventricosus]|uniref:Uncharacterized protein n=1 Tax=Araneus ventricosus TaxID=182803 RepID=A0A4Y2FZP4_ARAVE|nr:hypothetical protein AVEN_78881-1 [Araneus ventricosus]
MPHPSILCLPGMLGGPLSYSSQSCTTCNVSQYLLAAIHAQVWISMDALDSFRIVQTQLFERPQFSLIIFVLFRGWARAYASRSHFASYITRSMNSRLAGHAARLP